MNELDRALDRWIDENTTDAEPVPATAEGIAIIEARAVARSAQLRIEQEAWLREQETARRIVAQAIGETA